MDIGQFVHERVAIAGRHVLPSVRQLISIDEHGEPEPVGSCVLLWHRSQRYLISAAHVLDVFTSCPLSIGTLTRWHRLNGEFRTTNIPPGKTREDDPYDYALMPVSEADANALDGCHFLTGSQIALRDEPLFTPPIRSKYLAIGWPRNRLTFDRKNRVTEPDNLAYTGVIAAKEVYEKHGRDPRVHLLLEFDRKQVSASTGLHSPPSFDGLSGGGIFTIPGVQRVGDVSPPRLVGITTEIWPQHDLFVGTRIGLVCAAIDATA